ncbi:MAG: hypothetical protein HZC28_17310 [Spirochaetes bacterium]|nr:hypothetical protein [Spirochaetota bacterium]
MSARAAAMHLHDNDGRKGLHFLPGKGTIDWREFVRIYRESGRTAHALLERSPPEGRIWGQSLPEMRNLFAGH